MQISDLKHVRRRLPDGGQVMVIDTGALITPEATAMIQALHSRSVAGMDAHLLKLAQKGAEQFMQTYYVGYGDKSIGDCGTTTMTIEGVSMFVAKAIQHFALYNGQEASTRYIDFSKQQLINPHGSVTGERLLERMRSFHLDLLEVQKKNLAVSHPRHADEEEAAWKKAINARAFDVGRGFLPAGATTNLAWHSTLRQAADHLMILRQHPLKEVRVVANALLSALQEMHPNSFHQKVRPRTEDFNKRWLAEKYYFDFPATDLMRKNNFFNGVTLEKDGIDHDLLRSEYCEILAARPEKVEMPKMVGECGMMRFSFLLDFGSFRDLQRHRPVIQRMPLLTDARGFHPWYLEQLSSDWRAIAERFLADYRRDLASLGLPPELKQYYVPMGYRVACRLTGDLPALTWIVELRSGISVHPTLRQVTHPIADLMLERCGPQRLKLYIDKSPDRFNYKRGTHDIVERPAASA